ncbi:MAG: helix-turn-helix transcriptional regulator [Chloroflexi bacterium]|nr:helix-turn-helix transcriptional regulator [Chloroflexota bacterium]
MTRRGRGRPPYPDILTPAEWRILEEVRTGSTNAEIAIKLGISPYTVKYHVSNILGKLELRNRRQIATWQPEREPVRLGQLIPARVRAFLAPLALLPKPLLGTAAAVAVAAVAIPTVVLAVLLTRPQEPVNLLVSPAPAATPTTAAAATPPATPTPAPTSPPTPTPQPSPEPTPEPTATPEPTPEPPPEPPIDSTPNSLGIRQIPTDEAFIRLEFAPGELISEEMGPFFLDVETGAVEGWQHVAGLALSVSPGNRYVAGEGALHHRASGRTFAWDPAALRRVAWSGDRVAFQRLDEEASGSVEYVVFDSSLEEVGSFESFAGRSAVLAALEPGFLFESSSGDPDDPSLLGMGGPAIPLEEMASPVRVALVEEGFVRVSGPSAGAADDLQTCRVIRYTWPARVVSDVSFPCSGYPGMVGTGVLVSPDGDWIAVSTRSLDCCELLALPETHFPTLSTVSIFETATGEERLRILGGAFPLRPVADPGVWLADGSALVVDTVHGRQIVGLEGTWRLPFPSVLAEGRLLPSLDDPTRFIHDTGTLVDSSGQVLAALDYAETVSLDFREHVAGEVLIHQPSAVGTALSVTPSILPAIQLSPFDDDLIAEVVVDTCLNVRAEATTESEIVVCLPPERVVELVAHPIDGYIVEGPCVEDDLYGNCVWAHVLTEDSEQGWAYADFLRWPGTPLVPDPDPPAPRG